MKKKRLPSRYIKVVEWSDEDNCFIGRIPGLIDGGIHGNDEEKVYKELCQVAEEAVELYNELGHPLPPPTANKKNSGKLQFLTCLGKIQKSSQNQKIVIFHR